MKSFPVPSSFPQVSLKFSSIFRNFPSRFPKIEVRIYNLYPIWFFTSIFSKYLVCTVNTTWSHKEIESKFYVKLNIVRILFHLGRRSTLTSKQSWWPQTSITQWHKNVTPEKEEKSIRFKVQNWIRNSKEKQSIRDIESFITFEWIFFFLIPFIYVLPFSIKILHDALILP